MSDTVNTAEIKVVVDGEGVSAGLREIEQSAGRTARTIDNLGSGPGLRPLGEGVTGAAGQIDKSTKNMADAIARATAAMSSGAKGSAEYYAALANSRGLKMDVLRPYLVQLDEATKKAAAAAAAQKQLDDSMKFLTDLKSRTDSIGKTASELMELRAAELGVADAARPMIERMRQAEQAAEAGASKFGRFGEVAEKAKGILLALGAGAALGAFAAAVSASVDNLAELDDMAQKTGSSIESLSRLQRVATVFAADMSQIDAALSKLARGMTSVDDEGSKVNRALSAIGLSAKDASGKLRDPSELMVDIAKNLQGYNDGAGKAALVTDLFGKAGADLLPYLNDLAENYDRMAASSTAAASAASQLQDQIGFAKLRFNDLANSLATAALPALSDLAGAFSDVLQGQNDLNAGKGAEWADDLALGLARAVDVAILLPRLFSAIASSFKSVAADIGVLIEAARLKNPVAVALEYAKGNDPLAGLQKALVERNKIVTEANQKYEELWNKPANLFEQAMLKRIAARGEAAKAAVENAGKDLNYGATTDKIEKATRSLTGAVKEHTDALDANEDRYNASIAAAESELRSIGDQVEAQRLANELIGLSKTELAQLAARRLDDAAALKEQTAAAQAAIPGGEKLAQIYRDQAAELRDLAQAKRDGAVKQASVDSAKQAADEWKRAAESIEQSLTDALLRGFESGKSFGKNLVDTLKNMFNTLVLRPVIQATLAPVTGSLASMLPGSAQASAGTGSGGASLSQTVSSIYDTFKAGGTFGDTVAKGVQTGLDKLGLSQGAGAPGTFAQGAGVAAGYLAGAAAGVYGGRTISNGYAISGSGNGLVNAGTVVGAIVGGPIGAAIGGMIAGAANRVFGMRPKEVTRTSIDGTFGASGFVGNINEMWKQEGGLLRSDKSGSTQRSADAELVSLLNAAYDTLKASTSGYIETLGINSDWLMSRSQNLSVALTGDAAKDQQAIADFFTKISDDIAREFVPALTGFQKAGESASATLQRLATDYAMIDTALTSIGMQFGAVGVASLEARERLVEAAGGLEAFAANTAGFQQNFLTEAERNAPVLKAVTDQLTALGLAGVDTRDEFKSVVLGLDLTTEAGSKQYGSLMKLQAAFAQVYPAIEDTSAALSQMNKGLQDQIDEILRARMSPQDLRAFDTKDMDASTVALYDRLAALKLETAVLEKAAGESKSLQDQWESLTMTRSQLAEKERNALEPSNRARWDEIQAIRTANEWLDRASQSSARAIEQQDAMLDFGQAIVGSLNRAKDAAKALREFNDSLVLGNLSALDPDARYREAKRQFEAANPNDTQAAQAFLQASKDRGVDSFYYERDFAAVQAKIGQAIASADQAATVLPGFFAAAIESMRAPTFIAPTMPPVVATMQGGMSRSSAQQSDVSRVEAKVDQLIEKLGGTMEVVASSTAKTADLLDRVTEGGNGMVNA